MCADHCNDYVDTLHSFGSADGCPRETRTFDFGGISYLYTWQEVEIGTTLSEPCPCQDLLGSQSGNTFRQCTGTYSNGGRWSQVDITQCAVFVSEVTRHLCENAVVCELIRNLTTNMRVCMYVHAYTHNCHIHQGVFIAFLPDTERNMRKA